VSLTHASRNFKRTSTPIRGKNEILQFRVSHTARLSRNSRYMHRDGTRRALTVNEQPVNGPGNLVLRIGIPTRALSISC
jgi:hypothetical protein